MMTTVSDLVADDGRATQQVQRLPRRIVLHLAPTFLASQFFANVPTPPRSSGIAVPRGGTIEVALPAPSRDYLWWRLVPVMNRAR